MSACSPCLLMKHDSLTLAAMRERGCSCRQANLASLRSVVSRVAAITGHSVSLRKQRSGPAASTDAEPGPGDAAQVKRLTACSVPGTVTCLVCHDADIT